MRKQFTIFLILTFILGLVPVNFSVAITQNQIDAEVQIVCTDGSDNWFSGSGTIIDPKGIILTNRHVVEGAYMNTCFIGFIESIGQEPNFGISGNYNLAEVKYQTTSNDMDAAILYLDNPINKIYPYVNIWNSNSDALQFGDKIEVIGFPSIGGSTITYTSGDFSGFGDKLDWSKNCVKTTAIIGHGNSGGAAYNMNGQFIGMPTWVLPGKLNSMGYILSVNSIKSWLSGILGNEYQDEVIKQIPAPVKPTVNIKNDITPPTIKKDAPRDFFWFNLYDESNNELARNYGVGYDKFKDMYVSGKSRKIRIIMPDTDENWNLWSMDMESGVHSVYYSFTTDLKTINQNLGKEYIPNSDNSQIRDNQYVYTDYITPIITLPDVSGVYYIILRFKDNAGNISNPYILSYIYEESNFLNLINIKFYSDSNYSNMIGNYDFNMESEGWVYPQYFQYCATRYKDVYVKWQYKNNYELYTVRHYGYGIGEMSASESIALGEIETTNLNKYKVANLNLDLRSEKPDPYRNNLYKGDICYNGDCTIDGVTTSFLLKPKIANGATSLEGVNRTVIFIYNPNLPFNFMCGEEDRSKGRNRIGQAYYVLNNSKPLIEDSSIFDIAQQKIANALTPTQQEPSSQQKTTTDDSAVDMVFTKKQNGLILLQVEQNGEAYYVYPGNSNKYYLGRPADAFSVMRKLGLGATHEFITNNTIFPDNVLGKILLDVEQNGEAYYIYPKDKKAYYLGRPADAFRIMRELGLGITNDDLNKIPEGEIK